MLASLSITTERFVSDMFTEKTITLLITLLIQAIRCHLIFIVFWSCPLVL
ncbi:hypothetical protein LINGRAHAP2_LOCUS25190 [Linum grandiflorum]